jgi:hypothetical protein
MKTRTEIQMCRDKLQDAMNCQSMTVQSYVKVLNWVLSDTAEPLINLKEKFE